MRVLRTVLIAAVLAVLSPFGVAVVDPARDVSSVLLVSPNSKDIKLGAKIVVHEGIRDETIFGIIAQRFDIYFRDYRQLDAHSDTVAWLARALAVSESPRYRPMLESALLETGSLFSRRHASKVDLYIEAAIDAMEGSAEDVFTPQPITFEALREKVLLSRRPGNPDEWQLTSLAEGTTIAEVYEQFGPPEFVVEREFRKRVPFYGRVSLQNLELQYSNIAAVQLNHTDGVWKVYEVVHLDDAIDLAAALASDDPQAYREAARTMVVNQLFSEGLLDAAAAKAWENVDAEEPVTVDAVAWLCNALGHSGNPRYRKVLREIEQAARERKLQRYAARALNSLDPLEVTQFVVEDGSR